MELGRKLNFNGSMGGSTDTECQKLPTQWTSATRQYGVSGKKCDCCVNKVDIIQGLGDRHTQLGSFCLYSNPTLLEENHLALCFYKAVQSPLAPCIHCARIGPHSLKSSCERPCSESQPDLIEEN
ncbi:Hypothetical predicted protein [Pelobates cultripes]|uniref:Uncharacterized protein n=1 Tax=Pelobates cultripes TaxID=61616 RepID=A0AAD1WT09_PELCU|nr:Hypothetical predicted protein [Pelobates cultripes]